jgi:hypothetical protein
VVPVAAGETPVPPKQGDALPWTGNTTSVVAPMVATPRLKPLVNLSVKPPMNRYPPEPPKQRQRLRRMIRF